MRMWLLRDGNVYWNRYFRQWTSKDLATKYSDREVCEFELCGGAEWVIDYEEDN